MKSVLAANIFETLGLSGWSILFYVINFVVLVAVLVLLLYRPVKKMLKNKRESLQRTYEENEKLKGESEALKAEYAQKSEELKIESARVSAEAAKNARSRADAIMAEAKEQAVAIVEAAKKDAMYQKEQLKQEYRDSVNRLAVQIAQKMIEREITGEDNAELIEQVLSDWEDSD